MRILWSNKMEFWGKDINDQSISKIHIYLAHYEISF